MEGEAKYYDVDKGQGSDKKPKQRYFVILLLILVLLIIALVIFISVTYVKELQCDKAGDSQPSTSGNSISFLLFSDVHLDPFYKETAASRPQFCRNVSLVADYKAKFGRIGCDSPNALLLNALDAMKNRTNLQPNIEFILSTGDTAAHKLTTNRRSIILDIMRNTSKEYASRFQTIPYFPMIGNNDLPGHYAIPTPNDSWYTDLLDIWQDGILCTHCGRRNVATTTKDELRRTFLNGGYYNASVADGDMTLIVLNSMYWTKLTWQPDAYFTKIAETQMDWLETQLNLARQLGKKVMIGSHVPPGMDPYSSTGKYNAFWLKNFTTMYIDLVANRFSDVVAGQLYAHLHKDTFRLVHDETNDPDEEKSSTYILLNPSISSVYKNNPGFRVVHIDTELRAITDYEQYYMNIVMATQFDNPVWQLDYKFSTRYPPSGEMDQVINGKRIKRLSDGLINQTSDAIFNGFISSRQVRYQPDRFSRFIYYCAVKYLEEDKFNKCKDAYKVPGG